MTDTPCFEHTLRTLASNDMSDGDARYAGKDWAHLISAVDTANAYSLVRFVDPTTATLVADVLEAVSRFNEAEWSEDRDSREMRLLRSACVFEMKKRKDALDAHARGKN
jgi:hypothetical protein